MTQQQACPREGCRERIISVAGEEKCASCGRPPAGAPSGNHDRGAVVINIELQPETLAALFSAIATAEGKKLYEMLQGYGLNLGEARRMASGQCLYPEVAVRLMERYSITPQQLFRLMKAQAAGVAGRLKGGRSRGGPRKDARSAESAAVDANG